MKYPKIGIEPSFLMTFDPDYTLKHLIMAETAGFDSLWLGDHILPWHDSFKENFFVWSILPVIAARTRDIKIGVDVTVPIGARYHPAIVAQASATIDRMFPGRFVLGVGAGEAMNEAVFMGRWPKWGERIERLTEAIDLIRKLWTSEDYFTYAGRFFKMENVRLSPRPKSDIPIFFSAIGIQAAYVAGKCSNKLLTLGSVERCRDFIFPKFNEGLLSVGKTPSRTEKVVVVDGGIGDRYKIVKRIKTLIAGAGVPGMFDERDPRKIEKAGSSIPDQQIIDESNIFEKGDELIEIFSKYAEIGADQIIWQDFSDDPNKMLHAFQTKIIPYFKQEEK